MGDEQRQVDERDQNRSGRSAMVLVSSVPCPQRPATHVTEAQPALGLAEFSSLRSSVSIVICSRQGPARVFQLARRRARSIEQRM